VERFSPAAATASDMAIHRPTLVGERAVSGIEASKHKTVSAHSVWVAVGADAPRNGAGRNRPIVIRPAVLALGTDGHTMVDE
jgi:hypothetical protein